ncbi:UDP-glucose 4-epimerase [Gammaproteobacteria bacterium SCGC AG-212-F23]|nr:UDP-glucose 4-epimerase [Gammaproteobacteria bacterium SCGC AG-212-F23]
MVDFLVRLGHKVVVLDNLSTGHRDAVLNAELVVGDMADPLVLDSLFLRYDFSAVMHFASCIEVGESVTNPAKYYQNNVAATLCLLQTMLKHQVKYFIFSSSAAVYGEPQTSLINESHPLQPMNPYGRSKYMIEQVLADFARAYDFHFASLRYFNAAGADPEGRLCERHEPESHLIPLVLQVANGQRDAIFINGVDYPTADGTCVRDYVHVTDLCAAHLLVLQALMSGKKQLIYNLGNGQGFSVKQVIDVAREVTQHPIPAKIAPRRAGDPAILVADSSLICNELNWQPKYSDLKKIIQHAYKSLVFPHPNPLPL